MKAQDREAKEKRLEGEPRWKLNIRIMNRWNGNKVVREILDLLATLTSAFDEVLCPTCTQRSEIFRLERKILKTLASKKAVVKPTLVKQTINQALEFFKQVYDDFVKLAQSGVEMLKERRQALRSMLREIKHCTINF